MPLAVDLQKLGLSDKEARVYLAALELGGSSAQNIAKKAGVNRATTYIVLESLIEKGLCSTYDKDKKTYFAGQNPESLEIIFALQKKELEEKERQLQEIMPQLKSVYNKAEDKPIVRFFEGKEGIMTMINEQMASKEKTMRMVYPADLVQEIFKPEEKAEVRNKRIAKDIKVRVIFTSKDPNFKFKTKEPRIWVDQKKYPVTTDIALVDGKVRMISLGKKLSGVIIEDPEIYNTFVSIFELAWEGAKQRGKMAK